MNSIYLFFFTPYTLSSCADCSFASLPVNVDERALFAQSLPLDVMLTTISLLICVLALLHFRPNSNASAILPRQTSSASSSTYNSRFPSVTWDNDLWRVTTTALDQGHYQSRQSVANGYIGRLKTIAIRTKIAAL